jgi:hypothetical protein
MRDIGELNMNEGGRTAFGDGPSDELVGNCEREFGVLLLHHYLAFLRKTIGGRPEVDSFVPFGWTRRIASTWIASTTCQV